MPFYEELLQATEAEQNRLQSLPIIQSALKGEVTRTQYIAFLTQAYHHVKHTVPLLMACGSKLGADKEWLREAIAHYIEEEIGHQEWILNDIAACGGDADSVRHGIPVFETELMVAYAYDTIARGNPVGFFGMVHVLEGTSIQLAIHAAEALQRSLDLPVSAFTYLNSHGALDLEHVDFFRNLVNRLDSGEDKACLTHCAKTVFRLYGDIFRSLETVQ
ncbi:long-chain fatty acid--CoA ligase [Novimethylophilus kurashikiensis]|uniref:Long-chain fatty acid--CoA ligase n=1 Tax=Novimethylophilus kurashikiensis TaxID=1825523 RepID=A0A2R5FI21_9PROT|nr:iron-containing redox enzyme family protein [Novimethylophilus kurashikiensis]GBG15913.1 long-chain fatty acid--CoA ligase [Novimethylophilus kurashikiensis]